jgi:hypothetical protein
MQFGVKISLQEFAEKKRVSSKITVATVTQRADARNLYVYWVIFVKFGIQNLHVMPLSSCEFHKTPYWASRTSFREPGSSFPQHFPHFSSDLEKKMCRDDQKFSLLCSSKCKQWTPHITWSLKQWRIKAALSRNPRRDVLGQREFPNVGNNIINCGFFETCFHSSYRRSYSGSLRHGTGVFL